MKDGHLTRHSLLWLFAAQVAVITPRLDILPFWTSLVWLVVAFWYWKIYRGDWHFPSRPITWGLSIVAIVGIALEYRTALALEPQIALLITAFILKLLELKSLRDHWLLLMLSYFLVACGFVFSTSISTVAIAIAQLLVLLMAQQALFRPRSALRPMLGSTWRVFAQSIPLMLVLFVIFPRFGPLWSVPLPGDSATTGVSDSMSPGDVSKLSRSGELAFRASFEGDIPAQRELYWRGLALESFDGREWSRTRFGGQRLKNYQPAGDSIRYEVILEHGVHEWLLAIAPAQIEREGVRQDARYQWLTKSALIGRVRYEATSYPDAPLNAELENYERFMNLRLPSDSNPQTRALTESWRDLASPQERLAKAQAYFRERPFTYTLEPPKLGEHSVDEFLFGQRRGYCEHYASSLVVMMRAAGVPARVVVGYQGGERNEDGGYLLVHQSDAHAWAEVWLEGDGWVRVDPTAWVAPDRIELGADIALAGESGFLADDAFSLRKFSGFGLVANLRLWMDRVEYQWVRWIVNYDTARQWDLLTGLFGKIDNQRLALIVLLALATPLLLAGFLTIGWRRRKTASPSVEAYLHCCAVIRKQTGLERRPGETPGAFLERVREQAPPLVPWLEDVTELFCRANYEPISEAELETLTARLRRLRRPFSRLRRRPA